MTVLPCSPLEQIDAAAAAGFDAVGLRLVPVMPTDVDVMADGTLRRAIERRISATGLQVFDIEVFRVTHETDIAAIEPTLKFAADLGAQCLAFTSLPVAQYRAADEAGMIRRIAELCEIAARYRIRPALEFMAFRGVSSLEDAVRVVSLVGHENIAITIDALHLNRSGGSPASVREVDKHLLGCLQLCDAPAAIPADLPWEARYGRLYPGEGALPLRELLEVVPSDLPLCIEAPSSSRSGRSPADRAAEIIGCTRRLLAQSGLPAA